MLGVGQTNLFPNPSLEQYTICPNDEFNLENCIHFFSATNSSPDYLNECAGLLPPPGFWALPNSAMGYQYARTGQGCAGFATWGLNEFDFNVREYIEAEL